MEYLPHLERVLAVYSEGANLEAVMEARTRFSDLAGRWSEDDPWHETWSRLFLDWFGFDVPVPPWKSPVHRFVSERWVELDAEGILPVFRGLLATHRSVFEVLGRSRGTLGLADLVGGGLFRVEQPYPVAGYQSGDVIDARIIPVRGTLTLGAGVICHPEGAVPLIHDLLGHLRSQGLLGWNVVHLLARMNLQHLQGPTLKLRSIYTPKSFLIRTYV